MAYRITCIVKHPTHQDRHRRIQSVGGHFQDGRAWRDPEDQAIANTKRTPGYYEVVEGGRTVRVVVRTHEGREYLKTETDHYLPDNLLSLPECR